MSVISVLGLDPGVAALGYGVIEDRSEGLKVIDYGILTTSAKSPTPERLQTLYRGLIELMERYQPHEVAVELFIARNLSTALAVGQSRGVALLAAADKGLPVYEYTPLRVKQQVCGYGRGDKKQVQKMIQIQLELSSIPQPDDAADALALALCHIQETRLKRLIANTKDA
jgi:crossover junction endodeoxyribonuclease RuvC